MINLNKLKFDDDFYNKCLLIILSVFLGIFLYKIFNINVEGFREGIKNKKEEEEEEEEEEEREKEKEREEEEEEEEE